VSKASWQGWVRAAASAILVALAILAAAGDARDARLTWRTWVALGLLLVALLHGVWAYRLLRR
jgi:hypothetical protein